MKWKEKRSSEGGSFQGTSAWVKEQHAEKEPQKKGVPGSNVYSSDGENPHWSITKGRFSQLRRDDPKLGRKESIFR